MKNFKLSYMQLVFALIVACILPACSSDDDSPRQIELADGTSTEQTVYADQTSAASGIKFTAQAAWTATVSDITGSRADKAYIDWLTLSAYSGGAGEYTLGMTLKENHTGRDRQAKITIVCGDTTITIIVEQKAVKEDGTEPTTPILPSDNYDKLITKIVKQEYYTSNGNTNDEGATTFEFFYDDYKRLVKIVQTESDVLTTITIAYTGNQLSCEKQETENGVVKTDEVYKASATLNEALRIVQGEYTDSDSKGDNTPYLFHVTYTLSYDTNGYLIKSNRVEDGEEADEERITWTNGNPTQVWWGTTGSGSAGTKDLIDKATYGKVANKTNLDLNWFIALDSEGWDFAAADPYKTFAIMGYVGKRSANLAETMTDAAKAWNGTSVVATYAYDLDNDGTPTKVRTEAKHGDSFTNSSTYTITYNK